MSEAAVQRDDSATRKALIAIFVASFANGLAFGAVMPMVSVSMEVRGIEASGIGYVVAAAPFGLIVMSPWIGSLVNRFSLLGTMIAGGMVVVVAVAVMPSLFGVVPWVILRFIQGLALAAIWILSETWVNALATDNNRGKLISGFMITMVLGFLLGPIAVSQIGTDTWVAFYIAAAVIAAALIPLIMARDVAPVLPASKGWSFGLAFRVAPGLMIVALFAGVTDSTQISFFPVYAMREGFDFQIALYMLTAIIAGSLLIQFPLGVLVDRIGRNGMMAIFFMATIALGGAVPFVLFDPFLIWPVLVLWGGVAFGLYTLSIILLGDWFEAGDLAGANAALVAVYEMGSVSGPVVVGHAIDQYGPDGMPIVLVLSGVPVVIFFAVRRMRRK